MSKLDAKVFSSITPFSKQWVDLTPRFRVDLGSLDWSKVNHTTYGTYYAAAIIALGIPVLSINYPNFIYPIYCSKYSATNRNGLIGADKVMCLDGSVDAVLELQIKDSDFTGTAAEFKQYIAGTDLVYAKTKEFNMYEFLNQYQDFLSNDYGIIDLGSLEWSYEATNNRFYATLPYNIFYQGATRSIQFFCDKDYECMWHGETFTRSWDKIMYIANNNVFIHDHAYSTAEEFQAAMQGHYAVIPLAANVKRNTFIFNQANQANIQYYGLFGAYQTFNIDLGTALNRADILLETNNANWRLAANGDETDHSYRLQVSGTVSNPNRCYVFLTADNEAVARQILYNDPVIVYCYYVQ